MMAFRHAPPQYPFLWESPRQPVGRWHREDDGPVQYFSNLADAAWAEFIRHEEITDPTELDGIERAMWSVELPDIDLPEPALPGPAVVGDPSSYSQCQDEARRLRDEGNPGLVAPSAALVGSTSAPYRVDGGLLRSVGRPATTIVLFGLRPDLDGWKVAHKGRPHEDILADVRHY